MSDWTLVFGYQHVSDVPYCPCGDPGNYLSMEEDSEDRLKFRFRCWCGSTMGGSFDSEAERTEFLAKQGVSA